MALTVTPVWVTVPDLAKQGHKSPDKLYELARRRDDPLPVRYIGDERYGVISVAELESWMGRNSELYNDRRKDAREKSDAA